MTPTDMWAKYPDWSTDGSTISFAAGNPDPFSHRGERRTCTPFSPVGGPVTQLTQQGAQDPWIGTPSWEPDSFLLSLIHSGGDYRIGTADVDGSHIAELRDELGEPVGSAHPDWLRQTQQALDALFAGQRRRLRTSCAVMNAQGLVIRDAAVADASAMGLLHVRAWQSAYRGVMPDEYLDGLVAQDRVEMWHSRLSRSDLHPLLVAVVHDAVVGFAAFGAAQEPTAAASCGELYAMNLDPDHWGRGIGRVLLRSVTDRLISMGYEEAVLWVVPENGRARALYESEGWVPDGGISTQEILGVTVTDIRYRKRLAGGRTDA